MTSPSVAGAPAPDGFCHEALLYAGLPDLLAQTVPFIGDGLAAGDPVLVVVSAEKIDALRAELGDDADAVHFSDMEEVGGNPARIIPIWREFVREHGAEGRRLRGIGEPISGRRSPDELIECQLHESLLNMAFADSPPWWLLCPYDTDALGSVVLAEARRSHPFLMEGNERRPSPSYRNVEATTAPFDGTLPEPRARPFELFFESIDGLPSVRRFVSEHAARNGLDALQTADIVLAVHEVATNSIRHGGGKGWLRVWWDGDALVCEVHDRGHFQDPLLGRQSPAGDVDGGRGLWIANQLCDLVQLRTSPSGNVVRIRKKAVEPRRGSGGATE
jgi:anti-sigma regulatory factor (Ser/Thr protein kinase)